MMSTATADFTARRAQRFPVFMRMMRVTYRSTRATWRACGNRFLHVRGRVHDLDGAALPAAVAPLLPDQPGDLRPVQRVEFLIQLPGAELDREHVVRQQFPADQPRVRLHRA